MAIQWATARTNDAWQGMNWLSRTKRARLIAHYGNHCAYCGRTMVAVSEGGKLSFHALPMTGDTGRVKATVDHLVGRDAGGDNRTSNLVPSCSRCNESKGKRPWRTFVRDLYRSDPATATYTINRINRKRYQPLPALSDSVEVW